MAAKAKYKCGDIIPERCDKYLPYCKQTSTGKCQKKPKGPDLDDGFVIDPKDIVGYEDASSASEVSVVAPVQKVKKASKEQCLDIDPEYCEEPPYYLFCNALGKKDKCTKLRGGPELDDNFIIRPEHKVGYTGAKPDKIRMDSYKLKLERGIFQRIKDLYQPQGQFIGVEQDGTISYNIRDYKPKIYDEKFEERLAKLEESKKSLERDGTPMSEEEYQKKKSQIERIRVYEKRGLEIDLALLNKDINRDQYEKIMEERRLTMPHYSYETDPDKLTLEILQSDLKYENQPPKQFYSMAMEAPYNVYDPEKPERIKKITQKISELKARIAMKSSNTRASNTSSAAVLSEVKVPSPEKLVVSDLPKSNSGVAKTEQVMEQVLAANVSKGMLSRQKSVEILDSPAAQHYADLRQHLTQGEVQQLNVDMTAVHSGVETILEQHLATAEEKKALQALFDQYDLCQYVRTAEDKKLTIPKLTTILTSFGQVDKRVRQATTRSTICYIILSVVLMDPKTFIEKLAGINKGTYSKK